MPILFSIPAKTEMKHFYYVALGLILYGFVICFARSSRPDEVVGPAPLQVAAATQTTVERSSTTSSASEEMAAYTRAVELRGKALLAMEEHQARKARAAEKLVATRTVTQLATKSNWDAMLKRNMGKFRQLREEAARQPNGLTPCTICDGLSNLACVMCNHRDGRCLSCLGSGRQADELCPTCGGSGKCYLCVGSGQMTCPFCDDGTLHANGPMPVDRPPLQ